MRSLIAAAVRGAIAGTVATVPMSAFMLAAQRAGAMSRLPPKVITEAALEATGHRDVDERTTNILTGITHLGFGAAAGALFGVLQRLVRVPLPPALQGVAFAMGVWSVSYMGWVPALRIMPPAWRDERGRPESMIVAHWIYGGVLGALSAPTDDDTRRWS